MIEKIAIASDHAGYSLKEAIRAHFAGRYDWLDLGTNSIDSVDYPDFGRKLSDFIVSGAASRGVLVCGTGIGISIAANRNSAIRAALCMNTTMARLARMHNDSNVLALGERLVGRELAFDIVETFMATAFEGGRHEGRVAKLSSCGL